MKPNCYNCKHRKDVPGNAHSQCVHPKINLGSDTDSFSALFTIFDGRAMKAAQELEIRAEPHGIKSGWFMWPANFDPVWLNNCNGFEQEEKGNNE